MTSDEILAKLNTVSWYHRFEILPGVFTPGKLLSKPKELFAHLGLPSDLTGKRVLEVGTWDGPLAFECEARGGIVTALDIQDPARTGFNVAREILESKVVYVQGSVYDAARLLTGTFDYIFLLGVFYHLKHPVLAFEELSKLLDQGGTLVFEGECLRNYWENEEGKRCDIPDLIAIANSNIPLCLFYADTFKGDDSNWFIPNFSCLKGWMQAAGLKVVSQAFHDVPDSPYPLQRVAGVARKIAGLRIEHRMV
jgi:tRNA (mo5U34)-methyltransferase